MNTKRKPDYMSRSNRAAMLAAIENLGRRLEAEKLKNARLARELKDAESTIEHIRGLWEAEANSNRRRIEEIENGKYAKLDALIDKLHEATVNACEYARKRNRLNADGYGEA